MDDDYEGEANADLTLGILSKARNRPNTQLSLSPDTQAFFVSEEEPQQEIIELTSDGDEDVSLEIINDKRRLDGGIAAANPKRRKGNYLVQGDGSSPSDPVMLVEMPRDGKSSKKVKKKKNKKSKEKVQRRKQHERDEEKEEHSATGEPTIVEEEETPIVKKVSRGRRYFDPPAEAKRCFRCDETGHFAAECPAGARTTSMRCHNCNEVGHFRSECPGNTKRKEKETPIFKACYGCGESSHNPEDCKLRVQCTYCEKFWHHSRNCPQREKPLALECALCRDPDHHASSCSKFFFPDDLKEVQCYVCKKLGHLCCVDGLENAPQQPSCYNCGEIGHTGMTCGKPPSPLREKRVKPPSKKCPECRLYRCSCPKCYKCGRAGHYSRDCKEQWPADEGGRRRMKVPRWADGEEEEEDEEEEEEEEERSFNLDSKRHRRRETPTRFPKWHDVERNRNR